MLYKYGSRNYGYLGSIVELPRSIQSSIILSLLFLLNYVGTRLGKKVSYLVLLNINTA